jgi:hypothetical protein
MAIVLFRMVFFQVNILKRKWFCLKYMHGGGSGYDLIKPM